MGPFAATFLLGLITILLFVWYSMRKQTYWKDRNVPYVKPYPIVGSIVENSKSPLHETDLQRYRKYGRIYGVYEGSRPVLCVADPEVLRDILVKDFGSFTGRRRLDFSEDMPSKILSNMQGEDWKRVRTIVTPTFTTGKIKKMVNIFNDCAKTLVNNFREFAKKGETVEVKRIYGTFTMDVIASAAFSTKIDSHNDPENEFVKAAGNAFSLKLNWRFIFLTLFPGLFKLLKIGVFSPTSMSFFKSATLQIIEERKKTGQARNDFLQLLLDTFKEGKESGNADERESDDIVDNYGDDSQEMFKNMSTKKKLSHDELIAQCVIFFLAGYDTTASTLAFTTYELALNPDVQEKLIKEIDEALKENNGVLTYEAIQSCKYLDNVISETLRMYPPATRLGRVADEDYKLADTGITVPKGLQITIPTYAMHYDPEFFPNPEKYDPDRFNPEERVKRSQYAYLPFGAGPRNCIGMRFALMEIKVCLANIFSTFRVKRCLETKVPLEYVVGQGLLKTKGIHLKFEIREDAVKSL